MSIYSSLILNKSQITVEIASLQSKFKSVLLTTYMIFLDKNNNSWNENRKKLLLSAKTKSSASTDLPDSLLLNLLIPLL